MNADDVIKEATEKLAAVRREAFTLGALGVLKDAGIPDGDAVGILKEAAPWDKLAPALQAMKKVKPVGSFRPAELNPELLRQFYNRWSQVTQPGLGFKPVQDLGMKAPTSVVKNPKADPVVQQAMGQLRAPGSPVRGRI